MADHHQDESVLRLGLRGNFSQRGFELRAGGVGAFQCFDNPIRARPSRRILSVSVASIVKALLVIRLAAEAGDRHDSKSRAKRGVREQARQQIEAM